MMTKEREMTPERILRYIDEHYNEPIAPRDVAAALHYSPGHLTHVARRTLGASVGGLILRRRMAAARRLLQEGSLTIAEIARRLGFTDVAYFSRRFSQVTGASPSRWRTLHRKVVPLFPFAQDDAADVRASA